MLDYSSQPFRRTTASIGCLISLFPAIFLTIEIVGNTVMQKRKKFNKLPNKEENSFIKKWAAKVGLNVL
jgi:hypothetical protein